MLDQQIIQLQDQIVEAIRECIKIKSVQDLPLHKMPFGQGVNQALEYALDLAKKLGFRTVNLDNMVGYAEYGTGEEMIAVLGHLDVVPPGEGWSYPPFGAIIDHGKIYGRGIVDDKGPIIGTLFALKAIKDLQLPLKKRVRIIFGTNEENGSKCVKHYVDQGEEIPVAGFTPDGAYPIIYAEKGIVDCLCVKNISPQHGPLILKDLKGGTASNAVPSYAEATIIGSQEQLDKIYQQLQPNDSLQLEKGTQLLIKSYGITAHGSTPEIGKNAITPLIVFLKDLDLDPKLKQLGEFVAEKIHQETDGQSLGISLQDSISGKLTVNLGTIKLSENQIAFELNIRYPVTKKYEDFMPQLQKMLDDANIELQEIRHDPPLYVEPNTPLIQALKKVYEEKTGQEAELLAIGGGTYAKAMPNIVAFGPTFPGEPDQDHQPDEHMSIDHILKNVQIMAAAIYELAK
ncbi:dipeptidase PepV [Bacillota bacterium LX-D]|nr:dipeptidase PepV [Bacillota bacterium LX-D]